jgi:hypothetical protein
MSSLIVLCFSSHYRFVLLPHYELVPPDACIGYVQEFCYSVYNQCELFLKTGVPIERYFKWWTGTKLVWVRYQNY